MNDININDIGQIFQLVNGPLVVCGIIGVLLLLILFLAGRKGRKKNKDIKRREVQYYLDNAFTWAEPPKQLNFNFSCTDGQRVRCSRGNKTVEFFIPIERQTVICPSMVEEWFLNRNYNKKEEDTLLEELKYFLEQNNYTKDVIIVSNDEYVSYTSSDNNEEY